MSFRIEKTAPRNVSFATPGENYRILANAASLRRHLSDSYWCEGMEEVCDGQLTGVAVRYTGETLVMLRFIPPRLSPAGYRYPLYMSIPIEFLVPERFSALSPATGTDLQGSFGTATTSSYRSTNSSSNNNHRASSRASPRCASPPPLPKLCVVCGRYSVPGMLNRRHGWKCKECKGKRSSAKLRDEARKLQTALFSSD